MQLPPGGGGLGGIVVMSGYLPHSSGFTISPGLESMPVFHGHGELEPLVQPDITRASCNVAISGRGRGRLDYRLVTYPNLGHLVSLGSRRTCHQGHVIINVAVWVEHRHKRVAGPAPGALCYVVDLSRPGLAQNTHPRRLWYKIHLQACPYGQNQQFLC